MFSSGVLKGSRAERFCAAHRKQEIMRNLTFLAAALAAGLTTLAANAKQSADRPDLDHAEKGFQKATSMGNDENWAATDNPEARGFTREEVFHAAKVAKAAAETPRITTKVDKGEKEAAAPKKPYAPLIERYASMNGVSSALVHAVIQVESNYKPYSKGRAGEIGLMQIKPATARMMGYSGSTTGLFDPETNIKYGLKYLAKAQKLGGGTTCGTILKYNAGHAAKRMNPVSSAYCRKVKKRLAGI